MSDSNLENTGFFNQVTATLDYKPEVVNTLLGINSFGLPDKAGLEYEFINNPDVSITHRFYLTDELYNACKDKPSTKNWLNRTLKSIDITSKLYSE